MQSSGAIRQKLKQVKYRYLKRLLETKLALRPVNCIHNGVLAVPENGVPTPGLHICTLRLTDGSWNGGVCDEDHGGLERAQGCPHFQPSHSKDSLKEEFRHFFDTANYGEIAFLYPMAAALIWVLDGDVDGEDDSEELDPGAEPASEIPRAPNQETLDKLAQPEDETPGTDELMRSIETLREQLPDMIKQIVGAEMSDMSDRVGDLSASTVNSLSELCARLDDIERQPPAKIGWWDRMLGRGPGG